MSNDSDTNVIPDFEKKSSDYTPPPGEYESVDNFVSTCRKEIRNMDFSKGIKPRNITKNETQALKSLQNRADIVIKPADKGCAVCIWDKTMYIKEAEKQLSDTRFYRKLDQDITNSIQKELVREIKSMITKKELPPSAEKLIVKSPRCSQFYLLPKIHKEGVPGRPVVSNYMSPPAGDIYCFSLRACPSVRPCVRPSVRPSVCL